MSLLKIFKKNKKEKEEKSIIVQQDEQKISDVVKISPIVADSGALLLRVLKRPFISEKSHNLSSWNQYVFIVNLEANKNSVREAVEKRFNVNVTSVNIIRSHGKPKRFRNKVAKQSDFKKAIITLKKGQKIETI